MAVLGILNLEKHISLCIIFAFVCGLQGVDTVGGGGIILPGFSRPQYTSGRFLMPDRA